jgi:hypothetical protein
VVRGEDVGFLERSAVLSLFQTMTKGVDDSAGSQLPGWPGGRSFELLELRCPVKECPDSPVFAMLYDEDASLACRIHPDSQLELHR